MRTLQIDVWSDYVCPFCYLVEPTLARIEQEFAENTKVVWRAFELRPEPVPTLDPDGAYLREIWASSVYPMAEQRGMTLRLPPVQPRSRLAHEAGVHARVHGRFTPLNDAIFRAFFKQGADIGDLNVLVKLGGTVGLEETELRNALTDGRHRQHVLDDEALAAEIGISGVPALTVRPVEVPLAQAVFIEGAQPYEVIREVLLRSMDASGIARPKPQY